MGITFSNADDRPALRFNRIFLNRLTLTQELAIDHEQPPVYRLAIELRRFAVDEEGKRHYSPEIDTILIDDYYARAAAKATQGDWDLAKAAEAIEAALAVILEDQRPDLGSVSVVTD